MKNIKLELSGNPIVEEEFINFVIEFELSLPDSYKQFILLNNGGYPKEKAFGNPYEDGTSIHCFYMIEPNSSKLLLSSREVIEELIIAESEIPKHFFPFGADQGGNEFCISMRDNDLGSVWKFFLDGRSPKESFVTSSFSEFIDGLEDLSIFEDETY